MRITRPPIALRRAKLDNLVLVPASLLPYKNQWQQIANKLPRGDVLILLPNSDSLPRKTLERVGVLLGAKGHRVTTLSTERFG